jgi:hypothetical protein
MSGEVTPYDQKSLRERKIVPVKVEDSSPELKIHRFIYHFLCLEDVLKHMRAHTVELSVELIDNTLTLTARDKESPQIKYFFGPYEAYKVLLELYGLKPKILSREPHTTEVRLRKYAQLGYRFELQKRWNKTYLYAWKWLPDKKKRDSKYIGAWNDDLKRVAMELRVKVSDYTT